MLDTPTSDYLSTETISVAACIIFDHPPDSFFGNQVQDVRTDLNKKEKAYRFLRTYILQLELDLWGISAVNNK